MDQPPPGIDPSNIPLAPNPNGDPPNFNSPESLQTTVLATGIAFILVSGICVVLRLYTGLKKSRKLFADDYFCVAGEIVGIAQWAVQYTMMTHGLGRHSWDIPATALTLPVMKLQLASQMLAAGTHFAVKAALALFFIRVFGTLRWVRITCYSLLVLTLLSYASYEVIILIFCIPRSGEAWDHLIVARCTTGAPSTIAVGVCSVVADLVLFVMPFPIIAGLSLNPQKKRALGIVFLIGFLVVVTSVVGLAYRVIVAVCRL
ncbi:hypothetical protein MMYC01_200360 [Madurella mycetomatis]|uniref:Rhodopsin domain-containing protein n=1 Tax=Madurella mycetomatis TaxID=100816 RepID=A0A175WH69_9PEZI|nr:hypothetical protein MMYC01_200360 [Madurella mycetomatis]